MCHRVTIGIKESNTKLPSETPTPKTIVARMWESTNLSHLFKMFIYTLIFPLLLTLPLNTHTHTSTHTVSLIMVFVAASRPKTAFVAFVARQRYHPTDRTHAY